LTCMPKKRRTARTQTKRDNRTTEAKLDRQPGTKAGCYGDEEPDQTAYKNSVALGTK